MTPSAMASRGRARRAVPGGARGKGWRGGGGAAVGAAAQHDGLRGVGPPREGPRRWQGLRGPHIDRLARMLEGDACQNSCGAGE
jgi:hypothetical protein